MAVITSNVLRIGLAAIFLLVTVQFSWSQSDAKLVEAAKKEGKLVWYTSTNVNESKPLLDDFEKLYGIKGEIFRASGEKTLNRIVTEGRAGRWDYDVVTISEVDALMDAKLLGSYRSPEARSYIPEFKGKICSIPSGKARSPSIRSSTPGSAPCTKPGGANGRRNICARSPGKIFNGVKATP
jgi:hypothetical protein